MNPRVPMTAAGARKLEEELKHLRSVERPHIVTAIEEARAHGDLKENAEYHAAKEKQGFIEGRIMEIESKLSFAQIIDVTHYPNNGKVIFGATVHLLPQSSDTEVIYKIVGEDESDLKEGKISVTSPVARALVGKEEGELIEVETPGGLVEYSIAEVEYI